MMMRVLALGALPGIGIVGVQATLLLWPIDAVVAGLTSITFAYAALSTLVDVVR